MSYKLAIVTLGLVRTPPGKNVISGRLAEMNNLDLTLSYVGGASDHPLRNRGRLITYLPMMPGSALYNFIVLLFKIFQAKKILKIGLLGAEISLTQKSNDKSLRKIGLILYLHLFWNFL